MNAQTKLVGEREAAELLGVSVSTLRKWRSARRGPAFIKLAAGRTGPVRYDSQALLDYAESHTVHPLT